jgi:hypothetical protein
VERPARLISRQLVRKEPSNMGSRVGRCDRLCSLHVLMWSAVLVTRFDVIGCARAHKIDRLCSCSQDMATQWVLIWQHNELDYCLLSWYGNTMNYCIVGGRGDFCQHKLN